MQSERQHLEVVIGGEVLKEVAHGLHYAVEIITVDHPFSLLKAQRLLLD